MSNEDLIARSDRMFHEHGDVLIKVFSVLVALLLLGLYFLSTSQAPFSGTSSDAEQTAQ